MHSQDRLLLFASTMSLSRGNKEQARGQKGHRPVGLTRIKKHSQKSHAGATTLSHWSESRKGKADYYLLVSIVSGASVTTPDEVRLSSPRKGEKGC